MGVPKPERMGVHPLFMVVYIVVFFAAFALPGFFYGWDLGSYTVDRFKDLSFYFVPALMFSLFGIMTLRNKKSPIYALSAALIGLIIIVFIYQVGWLRI